MTTSNFTDADLQKLSANEHRDYPPVTVDLATELLAARTTAGKIAGYTAQPDAKVALVNEFKAEEERLLRKMDALDTGRKFVADPAGDTAIYGVPGSIQVGRMEGMEVDKRWLAIARTHFQEGWMALNRAVFQPQRIRLPEDDA